MIIRKNVKTEYLTNAKVIASNINFIDNKIFKFKKRTPFSNNYIIINSKFNYYSTLSKTNNTISRINKLFHSSKFKI